MTQYKFVQGVKYGYLEVEGSSGRKYYITPFENPLFKWITYNDKHSTTSWKEALPCQIIWMCSCNDFIMGKARRGENHLESPCTHITKFLSQSEIVKEELEALIYANKGVGNHKKDKAKSKG